MRSTLKVLLPAALLVGGAILAASCSGGGGSAGDPLDHLVVSPDGATVDTSTSIAVKATGVTKAGRHVAVTGVTWTATAGSVDASSNFSSASAGDSTLTATAQGKTGTGTIHVIAPGTFTAHVVDASTGAPIAGANVFLVTSAGTSAISAADGSATLTGSFTGKVDVGVEETNHWPVTVYGVRARDVKIPMRPTTPPGNGSLQGTIDFTHAFNADQPQPGDLWLAFAGPSIKGNILSFGLNSLLGPNRPIPGLGISAPSNVYVYSLTDDYIANAPPGSTAAWAIGGEVKISDITNILSSAGTSDIGSILAQALPIFNGFYYTVAPSLTVASNQTLTENLTLTTPLSKKAHVLVPPRPVTDPNPLVIAAADLGPAQGYAPVGLNAVVGSNNTFSDVHAAPLTGALAGSSYLFLVVTQEGGTGSSGSGSKQQLAVLTRKVTTGLSSVQEPDFFSPPAQGGFTGTGSTHVFAFPSVGGADLTLQTFSKTGSGGHWEWDVMTPGDATGYTLPMIAGTNGASSGASWSTQHLGLESLTYDGLLVPGGPVDATNYFYDADRVVITRSTVQ